jgi:hypothetical protein
VNQESQLKQDKNTGSRSARSLTAKNPYDKISPHSGPPLSSGPGRGPLKAKTGVRIPVGAQKSNRLIRGCFRYQLCYNDSMALKDDLKAYQACWAEVEVVVKEERRTASLELRWRQLNSAYAMAKGLGLLREDPSEAGVFERWAKLKEKAASQPPKA